MAQIGFYRANHERLLTLFFAENAGEGVSFDGIAEFSAGAVRFDVVDLGRFDDRLCRARRESRFPESARWAR